MKIVSFNSRENVIINSLYCSSTGYKPNEDVVLLGLGEHRDRRPHLRFKIFPGTVNTSVTHFLISIYELNSLK